MRFARRLHSAPIQADMTPMIDVVFQLLIFFLCNLQYRSLEGKLEAFLPKDRGVAAGEVALETPLEVAIQVVAPGERRDPREREQAWSGEGRYELRERRLSYRVGPRTLAHPDEVQRVLRELRAGRPDGRLVVDPRAGTIYDDVVPVVDAALAAGYDDITFRGQ